MIIRTSHPALEIIHDQPVSPVDQVADHLSELAAAIGYVHVPREQFIALSELVHNKTIDEDEPQFPFKMKILEAFPNLYSGIEVEPEHLVLAGLGYLVRKRRTGEVTDEPIIRAKAMANMLLSQAAGAKINLAVALPRVVGLTPPSRT